MAKLLDKLFGWLSPAAGDSDTQFTSPELRVIQPKSNALKAYRPWNLYRPNIQIDITEQDFYSTLIKENA